MRRVLVYDGDDLIFILLPQELKDENGRLYKLLAERDEEMRILRKQVNQERQAIAGKI